MNPDSTVNTVNHSTVPCSTTTRPYRSARMPAAQPPTAEVTSAAVAMLPAWTVVSPHTITSVGMRKV